MSTKIIIGLAIVLFILLLLGWSQALLAFVVGSVIGIVGYQIYQSEILTQMDKTSGEETHLHIGGVYLPNAATLLGIGETGDKTNLKLANNTTIPKEKNVPEYEVKDIRVKFRTADEGDKELPIYLTKRTKSHKGLLYKIGGKSTKYYLESSPKWAPRDDYNNIIGYRALRTKADYENEDQEAENHSLLLEKTAKLLARLSNRSLPNVELICASKSVGESSAGGPDVAPQSGILSMFKDRKAHYHQLSGGDLVHNEYKNRGTANITYDDSFIKMPVVEKHNPDKAAMNAMPMLNMIKTKANEHPDKLYVLIQDYIIGGLTDGRLLPQNVLYIGQAQYAKNKVILNAFIHPHSYDDHGIFKLINDALAVN